MGPPAQGKKRKNPQNQREIIIYLATLKVIVVTMPTATTPKRAKASLTAATTSDKANVDDGKFLGTIKIVFDLDFIKQMGACFVHWKGAPTEGGWYLVDRKTHVLTKISDKGAGDLEWHERLYVDKRALGKREMLALIVDYGYEGGRLFLGDDFFAGHTAPVVQVEAGHEAATLLRPGPQPLWAYQRQRR